MLLKGVGEGPSALGIHSRVLEPISRFSQLFFYFLIFYRYYVCSPFSFPRPFIGILGNMCLFHYLGN